MGLEKVVDDILRRGEGKRAEIIRTGEKERDDLILQAKKKIEEDRAKNIQKAKSSIAQMEQQEVSSAELGSKRIILESQRKIMDELKAQVLGELSKMPAEKRKRMYSKLIARAKSELGDCYVYSNEKDQSILQLSGGMQSGGTVDTRGGLVFESKDRTVRLDFRFETLLEDLWSSKMKEIYASLFG